MSENITYDTEGYFSKINKKVKPEEVYYRGKGICAGYCRLFSCIGIYIGLYVFYVDGFNKDFVEHEWNVVKFENIYYLIESTWGEGYLDGRNFVKNFEEFYFCTGPEYFFESHYPEDNKWQLINPPLSPEEFIKRAKFTPYFHDLFKTDFIYKTIQVKKKLIIKLNKLKENGKINFLFHYTN